jgi:DNA-binding NarL/FixJ family response regulator
MPVQRPGGRALLVGNASARQGPANVLSQLGLECAESDDPYHALVELCRKPGAFRALVLSLQSLYREELTMIATVKRRFPHVEIWLAQTDGRPAAMAEAMRMGADGLLSDEGLHRTAIAPAQIENISVTRGASGTDSIAAALEQAANGEPVLTADELRALLQEQPSMPPAGNGED